MSLPANLNIEVPFECRCGRPVIFPEPPPENLFSTSDPMNVARLLWHFGHHHANILMAARELEQAIDAWQNEGGA